MLKALADQAVLGGLFGVENRAAMLADRNSRLHFLAARRAIRHARGNVRPVALDTERNRGAAMQVRNFAERMAARPHGVTFANQAMIVSVAARGGQGELFGRRARACANEDSVVVEILEQILGDFAR